MAQTDPALDPTTWSAVVLPRAVSRRFDSPDASWLVQLCLPAGTPPPGGWPALYLLDGESVFASFAETAARLARRSAKTGVLPLALVGIGYDGPEPARVARRLFDFTDSPPSQPLAASPGGGDGPRYGGAAGLRRFLLEHLAPELELDQPLDSARRALWGHSLAGRFVLDLRARGVPGFRTAAAISPSLWWRDEDLPILNDPDLFVAVGGGEEEPERRMVSRTAALLAQASPASTFLVAEDEDHGSVISATIARALRFISARI